MKLYEISFQSGIDCNVRTAIQQIVEAVTTVEELLDGWPIDDDRAVSFGTGLEDDDPELRLIFVQFTYKGDVIADAYFTRDEPSKSHPSVVPMSNYQIGYSSQGRIEFDEAALSEWQSSLGFEYSEALCCDLAPHSALLPYVLSLILTDGGEVTISKADFDANPDFFEDEKVDMKAEGVDPDKLLAIYAGYQSLTPIRGAYRGWGTSVYFHMVDQNHRTAVMPMKHVAL